MDIVDIVVLGGFVGLLWLVEVIGAKLGLLARILDRPIRPGPAIFVGQRRPSRCKSPSNVCSTGKRSSVKSVILGRLSTPLCGARYIGAFNSPSAMHK